ncbi:MAG: hypothetical protein ACI906_002405 [Candidatus Latescibacterota bacterium]
MWDGSQQQVDVFFRLRTETTYPLLLMGSRVGRGYGYAQDNYIVLDHEGIVRYRTPLGPSKGNRFDGVAIRAAIAESLQDLAAALAAAAEEALPPEMTAVLEERQNVPQAFELLANYPNPFNSSTQLRFRLPGDAATSVRIYAVTGQLVRVLWNGPLSAGTHGIAWDGRDKNGAEAVSGVYFYELAAGGKRWARKMMLLR